MDTQEKYKEYVNTSFVASIEPVVIDRAKGATYYGADGSEYIDCFAGISVVNSGHGNERILQAAKTQMDKLVHCCSYVYYAEPVADLAEMIAKITPGSLKKSFFGNGGAEAIEGAVRLARRYTGRNEAVALTQSFHGRTYACLSLTGNAGRKRGGGPYMPGVFFAPAPYCYRCPLSLGNPETCGLACAHFVDDVMKYHTSENIAFFIAEPLMGEGGIIRPPDGYFEVVKEIVEHHGGLFVADEVQSGFGRTGRMFAIERYDVAPDIMVMAKGIANGFPLSCFVAPDEIADAFKPGDHLSTFGGNPVSCAASLANIRFMVENRIPEAAEDRGRRLKKRLNSLVTNRVAIGEVRGEGLMIGVELVKDKESREPAKEEAGKIRTALREKGIMIGVGGVHGNVLRIQPPLTIGEEELDKLLGCMAEIM